MIVKTGCVSYVSLEDRVPPSHPLRPVRTIVDEALAGMTAELDAMYAIEGRPSIAPERLLRALLLQVLYSVRSERLLWARRVSTFNLCSRWQPTNLVRMRNLLHPVSLLGESGVDRRSSSSTAPFA